MSVKATILIVDDDEGITDSLSDILEMEGYEVAVAHDGAEGVDRCQAQSFDCVLMDIRMPRMDGVEALKRIRALKPGTPVVMITAYSRAEAVDRARDAGALDVLFKPIDVEQLLRLLAALADEPTVLIVDDDPDFGESLRDALRARGYRPLLTQEGAEAPRLAGQEGCEAVILDMRLEGTDGLEVLREFRKRGIQTPVLIVTGYADELTGPIAEALDLNARAVVEKPLEMASVFSFLEEAHGARLAALAEAHAS